MLLVARDAITGAHRAGIELAAVSVVVAHLDGFAEPMRRVVPGTRSGYGVGSRVVLHIPRGPIEHRIKGRYTMIRWKAKQRRIVHTRRPHDLSRIHKPRGIEKRLDLLERASE